MGRSIGILVVNAPIGSASGSNFRKSGLNATARDRQQEGASRFDAAVEAARVRLRPIVMTSFAFILGVLPLVIAKGAGAEMRRTLGTAVFAGMIGVTAFGIFLTPVFFYVIRRFSGQVSPRAEALPETLPIKDGTLSSNALAAHTAGYDRADGPKPVEGKREA
jgi:hypothetical protein